MCTEVCTPELCLGVSLHVCDPVRTLVAYLEIFQNPSKIRAGQREAAEAEQKQRERTAMRSSGLSLVEQIVFLSLMEG